MSHCAKAKEATLNFELNVFIQVQAVVSVTYHTDLRVPRHMPLPAGVSGDNGQRADRRYLKMLMDSLEGLR